MNNFCFSTLHPNYIITKNYCSIISIIGYLSPKFFVLSVNGYKLLNVKTDSPNNEYMRWVKVRQEWINVRLVTVQDTRKKLELWQSYMVGLSTLQGRSNSNIALELIIWPENSYGGTLKVTTVQGVILQFPEREWWPPECPCLVRRVI